MIIRKKKGLVALVAQARRNRMYTYNKMYTDNIKDILTCGMSTKGFPVRPKYKDGTPAHTIYIPNLYEVFDISEGQFPIHNLRATAWKSAILEYLWIFQKQTSSLSELNGMGVKYWDDWDIGDGTIGKRYGETVKRYNLMNQILDGIKRDPMGRRHIIDLYQYEDFEKSDGLYPCQFLHHFQVRGEFLDLTTTIRSSDYLVAGTINKIQAIALLMMVAKATGYKPGYFVHDQRNVHIYDRHIENAEILLSRYATIEDSDADVSPILNFNPRGTDFYSFRIEDFSLSFYKPMEPQLPFELGV